jgi:hypothetical protein
LSSEEREPFGRQLQMPIVAEELLAFGLRQGRALKLKIPNWRSITDNVAR